MQAVVGLVGAGEDLDQGRLAGTVLADQRVNLAPAQLERDAVQCQDARESLRDLLDVEDDGADAAGRH
jgi:hypothetical protein